MTNSDAILGRWLRQLNAGTLGEGFDAAATRLLEQSRLLLPRARGAFLLSIVPRSKPDPPIRTLDWQAGFLDDPLLLGRLAHWLARFDRTAHLPQAAGDAESRYVQWLLAALHAARDADGLVICPLRPYVHADLQGAASLHLVLVLALAGPCDAEFREELDQFASLLANLRITSQAPAIARRCRTLAAVIDQAVKQILTRGPVVADVRTHFHELVSRIRLLLNCDTCQLFLRPRYLAGPELTAADDRVFLAAQAVADREGLRYTRRDLSLVTHLWCHPEMSPLNIADVLFQPEYRRYALEKLGLTRHFIGTTICRPGSGQLLGILAARDKYGLETGTDPHARLVQGGFSDHDLATLSAAATDLGSWLDTHGARLPVPEVRTELAQQIEEFRSSLAADTCQLYVLPETVGLTRSSDEEYLELLCHARREWSGEASYARGEGFTGQVYATGQDAVVDDGLERWVELGLKAQQTGRRQPGKYRVSQHLLAVKVPAPPLLPDAEALAPIGVIKVRDRLGADQRSLSLEPFTGEDLHLLHAFAQMISVRIAIGEYARQRRSDEMLRHAFVTHAFRHDMVGNLIQPAIMHLSHHPDLPTDLRWLPGHLQAAANMFDRSWTGASLAAGLPLATRRAHCDLAVVLRDLFPEPERCLSPDRDESRADVCLRLSASVAPASYRVACERRALELALLAAPIALYHAAPLPRPQPLLIELELEEALDLVRLRLVAPVAVRLTSAAVPDVEDAPAHIISYPKRIQCPPVSPRALQRELARQGARLWGSTTEGRTIIWIELPLEED